MKAQFTLRDILWLTVVVALAVGWWIDRRVAWERAASDSSHAQILKEIIERDGKTVLLRDDGSVTSHDKYIPDANDPFLKLDRHASRPLQIAAGES